MRKAFFRPPDLLHKSEDLGLKVQSTKNDLLWAWRDFKFFVMYVHIINKTLNHKFHPYSIFDT